MEPLRGYVLLVLESELVFNLIDTFFGGRGLGKTKIEGREFTSIEEVMIGKVVDSCLKDLENAWGPVEAVKTAYVRSEVNPQFATIVPPTDLVIVSKFELELEHSSGTISLCMPYAMIEPIRNKLAAGFQSDALEVDHTWRKPAQVDHPLFGRRPGGGVGQDRNYRRSVDQAETGGHYSAR